MDDQSSVVLRRRHLKPRIRCKNCNARLVESQLKRHSKLCGCPSKRSAVGSPITTEEDDDDDDQDPDGSPAEDSDHSSETPPSFRCSKCDKTFGTKNLLGQHVRGVHSAPRKCPFPDCDARLKQRALSSHVKRVHDKFRQSCENCGKKFAYGYVSTHRKLCTSNGSRPYYCPRAGCDATFKTSAALSVHRSVVHRNRIGCQVRGCNALVRKENLALHIRSKHERVKEKCGNCGRLVCSGYMNRHLQKCRDNGPGPYKCSEGCDLWFETFAGRSSHIYRVHRERRGRNCQDSGGISDEQIPKDSFLARLVVSLRERVKKKCDNCGSLISYGNMPRHVKRCRVEGSGTSKSGD